MLSKLVTPKVLHSAIGLAIVGAPAPGWDLGLANLRPPEADLRP